MSHGARALSWIVYSHAAWRVSTLHDFAQHTSPHFMLSHLPLLQCQTQCSSWAAPVWARPPSFARWRACWPMTFDDVSSSWTPQTRLVVTGTSPTPPLAARGACKCQTPPSNTASWYASHSHPLRRMHAHAAYLVYVQLRFGACLWGTTSAGDHIGCPGYCGADTVPAETEHPFSHNLQQQQQQDSPHFKFSCWASNKKYSVQQHLQSLHFMGQNLNHASAAVHRLVKK